MKFISCEGVKELKLLVIFFKTIVLFSIFRRRFHNETILFQKNENINIPTNSGPLIHFSRAMYILIKGSVLENKTKNIYHPGPYSGGCKGSGAPPFLLKGGCNDEFAPRFLFKISCLV